MLIRKRLSITELSDTSGNLPEEPAIREPTSGDTQEKQDENGPEKCCNGFAARTLHLLPDGRKSSANNLKYQTAFTP